jgi:hypothetical protein
VLNNERDWGGITLIRMVYADVPADLRVYVLCVALFAFLTMCVARMWWCDELKQSSLYL